MQEHDLVRSFLNMDTMSTRQDQGCGGLNRDPTLRKRSLASLRKLDFSTRHSQERETEQDGTTTNERSDKARDSGTTKQNSFGGIDLTVAVEEQDAAEEASENNAQVNK